MKKKTLMTGIVAALLAAPTQEVSAKNEQSVSAPVLQHGRAVRHDKSAPLPELIRLTQENTELVNQNLKPADYVYPNFTEHPTKIQQADMLKGSEGVQDFRGINNVPAVGISFDGIGQSDAPGGGLPPDTNGDVGTTHYVQYINTDWAIYEKATGNLVGTVQEGNTFWAGFGGPCETNNAGDPIVLFDKTAQVWVFSQFISGSNPNGSQCFAVSDRADITDPAVTFNRYQFEFPGVFNDYPHIGIWTDENGSRSGYYFVTHDFQLPSTFLGASFSVVERDEMIAGNPAEFVRFENVQGGGSHAYGALPAHLEGDVLPAGDTCAPFVHTRADLDAYLFWNLCVDWTTPANSTISAATILSAGDIYSAGVNTVPQPAPAPSGANLDNFSGRTMYRASARAYPSASGLPIDMAINHVADAGDGIAGVKWVNFSMRYDGLGGSPADNFSVKIRDEGLFSPDDDYRWMGAISIDQNRNLGLAYSVSSLTTFPSVRYTGRTGDDPTGQMRSEASCVVGTGVQTFVDSSGRAGRWGDYSSMSVDPVDQCTFWMTVEYVANTGAVDWENRICSFTFPECGNPEFYVETEDSTDLAVCLADGAVTLDVDLYALGGFTGTVNMSSSTMPGGSSVSFSNIAVNSFPSTTTATFNDLDQAGVSELAVSILGDSVAPNLSRSLDLNLQVSIDTPVAATLSLPADAAVGTSVRPVFEWNAVSDALSYRIEVATDAGFTNIIETGTAGTTSYAMVASLASNTQYYWRVISQNNCDNSVPSATFSFTTGEPGVCADSFATNTAFADDMEGDVSDWTVSGTGSTWTQSGVRFNSGVTSFKATDVASSSDQYLTSPSINIPTIDQSPITLSFWNFQNMEAFNGTGSDACWDAGLLEISTDGGNNYVPIDNTKMLTDPYNGLVTSNPANAITGMEAWCADDAVPASGDQEVVAVVDLDAYAGQTAQFRFRLGTDSAVGDEGWYIDDVSVQGCINDVIFKDGFE
ncbi:fibronectin type III domain-containing protein [Marinicella meishanensis]|uniref:fibronectin type III domain-containing protein n=1 Tax=Marinicella meishanensis TaxID=2873263 RepID=UPI001CBC5CE8|nr:fibronectin type III domain-containing protein [Marinicella sp. NBU2979]